MLTFPYRMVEFKSAYPRLLSAPLHSTMSAKLLKLYRKNLTKVSNSKPKNAPKTLNSNVNQSKKSIAVTVADLLDIDDGPPILLKKEMIDEPMIIDEPEMENFSTDIALLDKAAYPCIQKTIAVEVYNEKYGFIDLLFFNI